MICGSGMPPASWALARKVARAESSSPASSRQSPASASSAARRRRSSGQPCAAERWELAAVQARRVLPPFGRCPRVGRPGPVEVVGYDGMQRRIVGDPLGQPFRGA